MTALRLGFIGSGTITAAIVTGLCKAGGGCEEIWLSPRNETRSARLAARFPRVHVGRSNQEVLERVDVVMLAVRPQVAQEILETLVFRAEHRVISLIATFSRDCLLDLVAPAKSVTLAAPLPSVAAQIGPTAIYPPDTVVEELFGRISVPLQVPQASQFEALFACTAVMASYFEVLGTCEEFLTGQGVDAPVGHEYVAALFHALGQSTWSERDRPFASLVGEYMTRGGLNEQLRTQLMQGRMFSLYAQGLTEVLERIRGLSAAAYKPNPP